MVRTLLLARNRILGGAAAALGFTIALQAAVAPFSPSPANGATNVASGVTLSWKSGEVTNYEVYFGTSNPPRFVGFARRPSYKPTTLVAGTKYFWKVVSKVNASATSSPVWSFTAGGTSPTPTPTAPAPSITCPASVKATASASAGITVSYPAPQVSGGTLPVSVVTQPRSGSIFPIGTTTVTATATDASSRKASCSFSVVVTLVSTPIPPPPAPTLTLSCPADMHVTATSGGGSPVSYPAPTVSGGTAPVSVVSQPPTGSTFPTGTTSVKATATDSKSQMASCAFTVMVMSAGTPGTPSTDSHAYGLWSPSSRDTCTKAQHDAYSAQGPDGKRYPTWHPPTGPNGCTFGHEHGRNPAGSQLLADITAQYGGLLFGYGNEMLDEWNAAYGIVNGMRHEDHVGHKIEWENDITIFESTTTGGANRRALAVKCDFLMKVHQGTHSKDAFTNNMHELLYAMQCQDGPNGSIGTKVILTKMVMFGPPGSFSEGSVSGGFKTIPVGPATPTNSPNGAGLRSIPTINRVLQSMLVAPGQWSDVSQGLYEDWISSNYIRVPGRTQEILYFDPHFAVFAPSRFFWSGSDPNTYGITRTAADIAANVGRSADVCWMQRVVNGVTYISRGGPCDTMTNYSTVKSPFGYDDPRSEFNGVTREFYFNNTVIVNPGSVTNYYTDPFGNAASSGSGPGVIRQYISAVDNRKRDDSGVISTSGRAYPLESIAIGGSRSYGGAGVHAPN